MKTKKIKVRQGFTIVELVIVIGVIGVLAAILIPTFINLNQKANRASDESLVKNLNTALAMQEQDPKDKKNVTMHDAVEDLKDYGYLLPNLVTKSDDKLLWNQKTNRFLLENDNKGDYKPLDFWKIQDSVKGDEVYSVYAGLNFQGTGEKKDTVNVTVGFDAGDNEGIKTVNYSRPEGAGQEVIIRTNSFESSLTINAPADTVKHFGRIGSLEIQAIKSKSHHEYGEAKYVEISSGRIAMENGSKVDHIHVNAKETTSAKPTEFNEVIISKATDVEMPNFSRDDVEINAGGTLVLALQNGTEEVTETTDLDYVWLTKQGIYEQIKVSDNKASAGSTWANDSSVTANTQEAAKQIANNIGRNEAGQVSEQTVVQDKAYNITVDPDTREIVVKDAETGAVAPADIAEQAKEQAVEAQPDKEDVQKGATLFGGGAGTERNPYIIDSFESFQNISQLYSEGYHYYKVKDGLATLDLQDNTNVMLNGSFDGNNVKFTNVNGGIFGTVGTGKIAEQGSKLSNFTVEFAGGAGVVRSCGTPDLTFDNIGLTGYLLEDWNAGAFLRYGTANVTASGFDYAVNFVNCSSRTEVYSSTNAYSAILIGHAYQGAGNTVTINLDSATNENINNTVLYYTGTANVPFGYKYCGAASGNIVANLDGEELYSGSLGSFTSNKVTGDKIVKITANKNPVKASDGKYQITPESDTTKIVVTLNWQYTEWTNNYESKIPNLSGVGGNIGEKIEIEVSGTDSLDLFAKITSVEIKTGQAKWGYEFNNGKLVLNMTTHNQFIDGTVSMIVEQFTSGSNIAKYKGTLVLATKATSNDWVIK